MSYILDALRKADAQRERDPSRGIHAQAALPVGRRSSLAGSRIGLIVAVIVGIGVAVAAGSYYTRGKPPVAADVAPPTPLRMQSPQAVANSIVPPAPPAPPARVPAALPPPAPYANLSTDDRARAAREAAFSRAAGVAAPPPLPAPTMQRPAVAQPGPAPEPAPVTGLPPDAPKIAISGGVYSPSPAQRMLIVNGQVFNEGSEVAPGLSVEKIEPRTAVLKFRGARYTIAY